MKDPKYLQTYLPGELVGWVEQQAAEEARSVSSMLHVLVKEAAESRGFNIAETVRKARAAR